ncbi:hypothetical protein ABZ511_02065 [Nocardia gamkensis]|uniref:hypothetical protein n=1 Tax=Nocardia gamkensis TaxID=352869 RepID=UPI0033CE4DB8
MANTVALESLSFDRDALDAIGGSGALIGYARVSTQDQTSGRETRALKAAGRPAAAPARGQRLGLRTAVPDEQVRRARAPRTRPDESVSSITRLLGVSRMRWYKYVRDPGQGSPIR